MDGEARAFAAIDFLCCLILVVYTLIAPPVQKHTPSIDTLGRYSIDMTWPGKLDEDMDLWCEDPNGNVAWFQSRDAGVLALQHDDMGWLSDSTGVNAERMIVRSIIAGEYVCNVHVYRKARSAVTPVRVTLTRLAGADTLVYSRTLEMGMQGDEQTAFRFTLDPQGHLTGTSTLSKSLVYAGLPSPGTP